MAKQLEEQQKWQINNAHTKAANARQQLDKTTAATTANNAPIKQKIQARHINNMIAIATTRSVVIRTIKVERK